MISMGTASVTGVDVQPQIGYQWVFDNGFSIGVGAGISLLELATGHIGLTYSLPIGIAW